MKLKFFVSRYFLIPAITVLVLLSAGAAKTHDRMSMFEYAPGATNIHGPVYERLRITNNLSLAPEKCGWTPTDQ